MTPEKGMKWRDACSTRWACTEGEEDLRQTLVPLIPANRFQRGSEPGFEVSMCPFDGV
jgi:hypothetical protein